MGVLRRIFGGCDHKFIKKETIPVRQYDDPIGYIYVMVCEKCGEVKTHKVKW